MMATTTTRKPTRQTAANNRFLADCRYHHNKQVYKIVRLMVNCETLGEPGARQWLLQNVSQTLDYLDKRYP